MSSDQPEIFVGRDAEKQAFINWVKAHDATPGFKRAAVIVGQAGIGKSALLRKFAQVCENRSQTSDDHWFCQYVQLNAAETPNAFLSRLLHDTHRLLMAVKIAKSPDSPRQRRLFFTGLAKLLTQKDSGLNDLIEALIGPADVRPGWEKFVEYTNAVSQSLLDVDRNHRLVILIDPDVELSKAHADEWLTIAQKTPARIRVVIAQRPNDALVGHSDAPRRFHHLSEEGGVVDLSEEAIREWWGRELSGGRLATVAADWEEEADQAVIDTAVERYSGYPFAHDAVMILLATEAEPPESAGELSALVASWPREVQHLLNQLYRSICKLGDEYREASLLLQIFGLPTPRYVWAAASGVAEDKLASMLSEPRFAHLFAQSESDRGPAFAPFHALFDERLRRELDSLSADRCDELAQRCWAAIVPDLSEDKLETGQPRDFELLSSQYVLTRFKCKKVVIAWRRSICECQVRLGRLDDVELSCLRNIDLIDERNVLEHAGSEYAHLGTLSRLRHRFDDSIQFHERSMKCYARANQNGGVADQMVDIAMVYEARNEFAPAERIYKQVLENFDPASAPEFALKIHTNLGVLYARWSYRLVDPRMKIEYRERAKHQYQKAEKLAEQLGLLRAVASTKGNLGVIAEDEGDYEGAWALHTASYELNKKLGRILEMLGGKANLGHVAALRGDTETAREYWAEVLPIVQQKGFAELEGKINYWSNEFGVDLGF